jgi:putative ABC transport system substrate-binding protein
MALCSRGSANFGYVEGQNLVIERRYAEGRTERFQEFAAEMVRLNVDLIIVVTTPAALAARKATTTIPIVHPAAIDPVGTGLIASLAHPGGNITGLAVLNAETSAKRLELLREVLPGWREVRFSGMRPTPPIRSPGKKPKPRAVRWQ